jgi:hypothetical protein
MKIDIYSSARNRRKYLSVPAGTDLSKIQFPANFDPDLRTLRPFKSQHEIVPGKPQVALNTDDVASQIQAKGFAEHSAAVTIKVSVATKRAKC